MAFRNSGKESAEEPVTRHGSDYPSNAVTSIPQL